MLSRFASSIRYFIDTPHQSILQILVPLGLKDHNFRGAINATKIYGLLILLSFLLIACGGDDSGSPSRDNPDSKQPVVITFDEILISPHSNYTELQWQNPLLADNQGIYQFTIDYSVVPRVNRQVRDAYEGGIRKSLEGFGIVGVELNQKTRQSTISVSQSRIWDWDEDNIVADKDNCLYVANPSQEDADQDGIGDACDKVNASLHFIPDDRQVNISWFNPLQPGEYENSTSSLVDSPVTFSLVMEQLVLRWTNPDLLDGNIVNITQFTISGGAAPISYVPQVGESKSAANVSVSLPLDSLKPGDQWNIMLNATNSIHGNTSDYLVGTGCVQIAGPSLVAPCDSQKNLIANRIISSFTLTISDRTVTDHILIDATHPGFSANYGALSYYIYNKTGLNNDNYDVMVNVTYNNGNNIALTTFDSPTGHPYQASVRLGPNNDRDALADSVDPDLDSDGLVNDVDAAPLLSALRGRRLLAYEGNSNHLALYSSNANSSYNLTGLAPDSHYTISVTAHVRTYETPTLAASLGYNTTSGEFIPNSIDASKEQQTTNVLSINNPPIFVTTDTDGDSIINPIDLDDDNDELEDEDEPMGCALDPDCDGDSIEDGADDCVNGISGWQSNSSTDFDSDGCRDSDEDLDDDNDGVADTDEIMGCELKPDCDNDTVLDGDEVMGCVKLPDCDDDTVLDGDEVMGCVKLPDCDNDTVADGIDMCVNGASDWQSNSSNDFDSDGCRNDEDLDDDNDRVADSSEPMGCALNPDCDGDTVLDGDEATGCILNIDCDGDGLNDRVDACPYGASDWIRNTISDFDDDGCRNDEDRDVDGDKLIEIQTQQELYAIRYFLNSPDFRSSNMTTIEQKGCKDCRGYELINNIALTDYSSDEGWFPIGSDGDADSCQDNGFNGVFDGNGYTISGLYINRPQAHCVGLFGQIEDGSIIRSLQVQADRINGLNMVGVLVGHGSSIRIQHSTVTFSNINGTRLVGGLVGYSQNSNIINVTVSGQDINNIGQYTGGLAGGLWKTTIVNTNVTVNDIMGENDVGGLMGYGVSSNVINSHIKARDIIGNNWVGGLIAGGAHSRVVESSSEFDLLSGNIRVGGLVGMGTKSTIISSIGLGETIEGSELVGGLMGSADDAMVFSSSSSFTDLIGESHLGGLIGGGNSIIISNSTASSQMILGTKEALHENKMNDNIGGLVGITLGADIIYSSASTGLIQGNKSVGGLIGYGQSALIRSSYAITDSLEAESYIGGLIGNGIYSTTIASFAITDLIRGNDCIGGIVGDSRASKIIASYAVINTSTANSKVGGLAGEFDLSEGEVERYTSLDIKHSYVVGGDNSFADLTISDSVDTNDHVYYDKTILDKDIGDSNAKDTRTLQTPEDFNGTIYADWNKPVTIGKHRLVLALVTYEHISQIERPLSKSINSNLAAFCDDNLNGRIDSGETTLVWDLGTSTEYPAINCTPLSAAKQRKVWSVEEGAIQLNFPSSQ